MVSVVRVVASGLLMLTIACGGTRHVEEHETERGAIPEDVVGPPNVPWQELDHEQRKKFMKRVVLPTMKPLFVAFDPKRFRDFDCTTCHGDRTRDFKMPNPKLFVLPERPEETLPEDKRAWLMFMTSEVEPEMAKLLGLPTPTAFACRSCHPRQ